MDCYEEGFNNENALYISKDIKIENFLFHGLMELMEKELNLLV